MLLPGVAACWLAREAFGAVGRRRRPAGAAAAASTRDHALTIELDQALALLGVSHSNCCLLRARQQEGNM
jgi:hypothetical protein